MRGSERTIPSAPHACLPLFRSLLSFFFFYCCVLDYAVAVGIQHPAGVFQQGTQLVVVLFVDISEVIGEDNVVPAFFHAALGDVEEAKFVGLA